MNSEKQLICWHVVGPKDGTQKNAVVSLFQKSCPADLEVQRDFMVCL